MPKHYEDEIVLGGERLRHYFKDDTWSFQSYGDKRHATRAEAIREKSVEVERRRKQEIRDSFVKLAWRDLDDLYKCPECYAVVEVVDLLDHHEWHGLLRGSAS